MQADLPDSVRTISPVDGSVYVTRPFADDGAIRSAIATAHKAQQEWRRLPLDRRIDAVRKGMTLLLAERERYSTDLSWQMGRPIRDAPAEFAGVEQRSDFMLRIAEDALQVLPGDDRETMRYETSREPLGLVFAISPWNYPYLTAVNTIVPALVAGNAVILKPSPQTPLSGEHFATAFSEAGLPTGVFQCLHMGPDQLLNVIRKENINHVAFTGSTANGAHVERAAAARFLSVGLELGGKDAAYVRKDADIGFTAGNLVDGAYFNAGQSCCAVERIYVERSIYADFVAEFSERSRKYAPGNPLEMRTTLGPVVSLSAANRILSDLDDALRQGAEHLFEPDTSSTTRSIDTYVAPHALVNVNHGMRFMQAETFGPAVGIMAVQDDQEAVRLINDSPFGLTASLWTRNVDAALEISSRVDTGTVYLNCCDVLEPSLAWTGVKQSGRGCTLSRFGFDALTRPKSLNFRCKVGKD